MAENEVKLLPCPFCGHSAALSEVEPSGYVVECANGACNASTNIRYSCGDDARPLVIEQWNRRAYATEAVRMNQAAGGEAVAWLRPEDLAHLARQNGPAKVDAWNCASGPERVPVYTTPPAAQVQQEAVELTVCCGREECGGECGNEWRGTEWVRKATHPAADALGAVRELVAKWKHLGRVPVCALESALAQAPAVRVTDEMLAEERARAERLAEAGRRVTAAFRALGEATAWTRAAEQARHECEAAMLALDAALEQEEGRG